MVDVRNSPPEVIRLRPTRDRMLMQIAEVVSARGTCTRLQVGAVIARDGRVISTGYVGAAPGAEHCTDGGELRGPDGGCLRTIHAEANAIAFAARAGAATDGADLYTTHSPCFACAKLLVSAGIRRVVYRVEYRDAGPIDFLRNLQLVIDQLP